MDEMVEQIDVGENSHLVNEILNYVTNGEFFKKSVHMSSEQNIVTEFQTAKELAWYKVYGQDELTWSDLRSEKMSEIWGVIYDNEEKYTNIDINISSLMDKLSRTVQLKLDKKYKELLDDIVSDLKGCLYSRAVLGKEGAFFESIFSIYLNGGWPCGWEGEWPSGRIIYYESK